MRRSTWAVAIPVVIAIAVLLHLSRGSQPAPAVQPEAPSSMGTTEPLGDDEPRGSAPPREAVSFEPEGAATPAARTAGPPTNPQARVRFRGRVLAAGDGMPIEGASISLPRSKGSQPLLVRAEEIQDLLVTEADGTFELDLGHWGAGEFLVFARGHGPRTFGAHRRPTEEDSTPELRLERGADLIVDLVGFEDRIAEVRVEASIHDLNALPGFRSVGSMRRHEYRPSSLVWSAERQGSAPCRLEDLPARAILTATIFLDGQLLRTVGPFDLEPGERRELTWELFGGTVTGRVLDERGDPVVGEPVWLEKRTGTERGGRYSEMDQLAQTALLGFLRLWPPFMTTTTDEAGAFRLEGVPPGKYWVGAVPGEESERAFAPIGLPIELAHGLDSVRVELIAESGLYVSGRIREGGGPPRSWSGIFLERPDVFGYVLGYSAFPEGTFRVGPVSRGEWLLTLANDSRLPEPIPVQAGQTDVEIQLVAGAQLEVTVLDAQGRSVRADISILKPGRPKSGPNNLMFAGTGPFLFLDLAPAEWYLVAHTKSAVAFDGPYPLAAGAKVQVELRLEPGTRLTVRCPGVRSGWIEVFREDLQIQSAGFRRNQAVDLLVPPGPLELRLMTEAGLRARRETVAAPDEDLEVVLEAEPLTEDG